MVGLADAWGLSEDTTRQRCGHGLPYEISKDKRKSAPDEAWFLEHIDRIRETQAESPRRVRMAMGGAITGVGKRSKTLYLPALVVANEMGPIPRNAGCDPFDVSKHLTSAYLVKKRGL